jgi:uncharacterized DUF497 family protein
MSEYDNFEILAPDGFEWDEQKAEANIAKHKIDFEDAIGIFYEPVIVRQSDRNSEKRWVAIGELASCLIAVIYTLRGQSIRVISARRARKNEESEYRRKKMGRPAEGKD